MAIAAMAGATVLSFYGIHTKFIAHCVVPVGMWAKASCHAQAAQRGPCTPIRSPVSVPFDIIVNDSVALQLPYDVEWRGSQESERQLFAGVERRA